ncbi:MAG: HEAT repeat domain-containing protein [Proteobacteria bacterium]|nr:HEAT repeat domain-containing protein [Pseudomonadota bacterium]
MARLLILLEFCALLVGFETMAQKGNLNRRAFKTAVIQLQSPDPDQVMDGVQTLSASGSRTAAEPLAKLLKTGPRNDITDSIIQTLGFIGHPSSIQILIEYLQHRRPDARIAAIYALENFKDHRVARALENALRDSSAEIRSTAALALSKQGDINSVPVLFQAFERGVDDAAISIGQLGNDQHSLRLATYLGKADIKILLPGFDEFLRRSDIPQKAKLEILNQLFELAGPDVRRFAVAYRASFPPGTKEEKNELFKKANQMVRQIQEE